MIRYLARRASMMLVTLFAVTVTVFLLGRLLPAPMTAGKETDGGSAAAADARRWQESRYGLDRPLMEQYLRWCRGMVIAEREVLFWTDESPPRALYQNGDTKHDGVFLARTARGALQLYESREGVRSNIHAMSGREWVHSRKEIDWRDRAALMRMNAQGEPALHSTIPGRAGDIVHNVSDRDVRRASTRVSRFEVTLGRSRMTNRTVRAELSRRLPISMAIGITALALIYSIGPLLGALAGLRAGGRWDRIISAGTLLAWSLPMAVSATLLFGWVHGGGAQPNDTIDRLTGALSDEQSFSSWLMEQCWRAALPAIVLALPGIAYVSRQMRASMAEQMRSHYVQAAMAKGCSRVGAMVRHAMRPSMLTVVTLAATTLPVIIGGSIIVESVFGIDGMGRYIYHAALNRDYDVVQSFTLIAAALNMAGLFAADVLYILLDPRIRVGAREE